MKRRLGIPAMGPALLAVAIALAGLAGPLATPVKAQRKVTRPQILRPEGPVWQVIRKNCTSCHGIDDYAFHALDRAGWQSLIETSHKTSPIVLSDDDRDLLLDWLVSKFGKDTKPFPRTYLPPEITTFFSDPEAQRLMNRACTSCHTLDQVARSRNSEDQWRVIAVDMRERGAKLTDEELERLVEWLGRVWGTNKDK